MYGPSYHSRCSFTVGTDPQLNIFNGQQIFGERTIQDLLRGRQKITWLGSHSACYTLNLITVPLLFPWFFSQADSDIRYAKSSKRAARNSMKLCRVGDIISHHVSVIDPFNNRTFMTRSWRWPVIAYNPEGKPHCLHSHSPNIDVFHITSPF